MTELLVEKHGVGIWIQDAEGRWHRSIDFDGHDHDLACRVTLAAGDSVQNVSRDLSILPGTGRVCDDCREFWETEQDGGEDV
jgi:hypothetical protein